MYCQTATIIWTPATGISSQ